MNRKHSSSMDSFFSSFKGLTYCLFYLLIPFAIHPVPNHFTAGKILQSYVYYLVRIRKRRKTAKRAVPI